jgi:FHS family L-fucose permease-like MFS transporter
VLGAPQHGATRINIAKTINGGGWILGPIVGGQFVFGNRNGANANAGLSAPYLEIGVFVGILIVIFAVSKVPDLHPEEESRNSAVQKNSLKPSSRQLAGIAVALALISVLLYFFIAPILGLIWALLNLPAALFEPAKYVLLLAAYIAGFLLVSKTWGLFRRKHFTLVIGTQFLYVAAQTGIFSFCVNYTLEDDPVVTKLQAAHWLAAIGFVLFMLGRLCGSAVISQFKPHLVLAAYAAINIAFAAVCMEGGTLGLYAMFGTFFFMSVMFPTIFALSIRSLGDYTKLGSSPIVMSIVGGAIARRSWGILRMRTRCAPGLRCRS